MSDEIRQKIFKNYAFKSHRAAGRAARYEVRYREAARTQPEGKPLGWMIARAIDNQEDILPGKPARQDIQEALEASRVRRRHNQIDAGPASLDVMRPRETFSRNTMAPRGSRPIM